jgi:hypothetical protein
MKSILRALALTGIVAFGAAAGAQAQTRFYVGFGAPVAAAVPPCPGDGYVWTPAYYDGYGWIAGRWTYRGYDRDDFRARVDVSRGFYDHDRDWNRRDNRNYDRGNNRYDRDGHDRDRGHDRH